jgi:F420-non-reducing hydrogenase iron-sulfur subunit
MKIYLFCCSTNIDVDELDRSLADEGGSAFKIVSLPCSGRLDALYMVKAFETGADGAAVVTCALGECRRLEGNLRAGKRVEALGSLLEEIGMGKERIAIFRLGEGGIGQLAVELNAFRALIERMPAQSADVTA